MFFFGLLALLQVGFLPGFLMLMLMRYQQPMIPTVLFSFGLSLFANYILVTLLTILHCYTSRFLYGIVFIELAALIPYTTTLFSQKKNNPVLTKSTLFKIAQSAALLSIIWLISFYIYSDPQPKSIFSLWDAVVSWNRWALDWYQNKLPLDTAEYPQLLPINISITYQFIGNSAIQLFGKILFYFFPFAIIACLWDMSKRENSPAYLWAIVFFILFTITLFGELSVSGYADIPVASFSMLAVYSLLICQADSSAQVIKQNIFIGTCMAASAAMTKQAGLELAAIYPLFVYLLVLKRNPTIPQPTKIIGTTIFWLIAFISPWYLYKFLQIQQGMDHSMLLALAQGGAHHELTNPSLINRFLFAIHLLLGSFHLPFKIINTLFITTLIILGSLYNSIARQLTLFLVLPMFLIWACFFSYDIRNIAFILPFASVVLGFGTQKIFLFLENRVHLTKLALASLLISVLSLSLIYQDKRLLNLQLTEERKIGNNNVNQALYDYLSKHPSTEKILTNYQVLHYLPDLGSRYQFNSNSSVQELLTNVQEHKAAYILIMKNHTMDATSTLALENYLDHHPKTFVKIFEQDNFLFYKSQVV